VDNSHVRSALVTGATGFIGRSLCARLKSRAIRVRALARRSATGPWDRVVVADIGTNFLPDDFLDGIDTVFHLAGKAHATTAPNDGELDYIRANVEGTRNVLEAVAKAGVARFVFVSSVKAGGESGDLCLDETMEDKPETFYGRTKLDAERMVFDYAREHKFHAVILRLPLVYGPDQKGNLVRMLRAVAARRFPPLPEFGNRRSMVHVDDVAQAAILAAESPIANLKTYMVTDGRPYSTHEIHSMMCHALGRGAPSFGISVNALKIAAAFGDAVGKLSGRRFIFNTTAFHKLASSAWYSSRKLETELGFQPEYDLEKALPAMIAELRNGSREHPSCSSTN
jgi:UDP-glucose 4-epimerase